MDYNPSPVESPSGDSDTPPPTVEPMTEGWHHSAQGFQRYYQGNVVQTLSERQFAEYTTGLLEEHRKLRVEQIDGSDHRLIDFWEKAQELADNANHCEIFDQIAEALGGPRREREFEVEFTFTQTITVTARDEESAEEYARDMLCNYTADDLYEYDCRVN